MGTRRPAAARCMVDMEPKRFDEAEDFGAPRRLNKGSKFKTFEPDSQTFVNETTWTRSSTSSAVEPAGGRRKQAVLDRLSKFPRFHFVNVDGPQPSSPASRSALRAHVMRQVCKEKDDERRAAEATRHVESRVGATSSFLSGSETSRKQNRPQRRTEAGAHAPSIKTLEGQLQPVGGRALEARPNCTDSRSGLSRGSYDTLVLTRPILGASWAADMEYVHYFIQVFAKSLLPMSSLEESLWFWKATNDKACYHSTLFVSQAHQALMAGHEHALNLDCHRHKGEAIKQIKEHLSEHSQTNNEGAIAAIACLAAYENLNGSRDTATAHISGLETIGSLRGGFHSTDMAGFLEQLVHWVELSNASAGRRKSRFVPQDLLSRDTYELASANSTIFSGAWNSQWGVLAPTVVTFRMYKVMTPAAAAVFHRLRQLSHIRAQVQSVRTLDAGILYRFTKNVSILERHINTIVNWPSQQDTPQPARCMPLYSSTLAFIYVVFRDVPVASPILEPFVVRLKRVLDGIALEAYCQQLSPSFLLWILFLGCWIAQGRRDWPWYRNALAWLTRRLGLCTWEQVKSVLAGYCLVESVCEAPFRKLWVDLKYETGDSMSNVP